MAIGKIKITNFKSFKRLEVEMGKFNVLIGANASGKSNFIQIFKFLRDIMRSGLENAISMQGGIEYLRNINIGPFENLAMDITVYGERPGFVIDTEKGLIGIKPRKLIYEFAIEFKKRGLGFKVVKDKVTQKCEFVRLEEQKKKAWNSHRSQAQTVPRFFDCFFRGWEFFYRYRFHSVSS